MGRYHYVNATFKTNQNQLRKVEKESLKERRQWLKVEISRLLKMVDQRLQEERLLLTTMELKKMTIVDHNSDDSQLEIITEKMEISDEDMII